MHPDFTCNGGTDDVIDLSILQRQVPDHGAVREQQLQTRATNDGHAQVQVLQSENGLLGYWQLERAISIVSTFL